MRHRAHQLAGGPARQTRVCIERDHVADAVGRVRSFVTGSEERGIRRASQQAIQLAELAALAFPSHPFPLAFVPKPPPMEEEEARLASRESSEALVQAPDPGNQGR